MVREVSASCPLRGHYPPHRGATAAGQALTGQCENASALFHLLAGGTRLGWRMMRLGGDVWQLRKFGARFFRVPGNRSPRATAIVGVEATYWYGRDVAPGLDPSHAEHNGPENDKHATYTVRYDLELDARDEIVGGEWREFKEADAQTLVEQTGYHHPDIVWLMPKTVKPFSIGDWDIIEKGWDGSSAVPAEFIAASRKSSAWTEQQTINGQKVAKMYPQPLLTVVERLVELSRR
jgi:hypothetical protein